MRLLLLVLALVGCSGCGGGGPGENPGPDSGPVIIPPPSPPPPAKVGYWECNGSAAHTFTVDLATLEYVCHEKATGLEVGRYFNASNLGLIALPPARPGFPERNTPFPANCNQDEPVSERQALAIRLLHEKAKPLGQGVSWFYDYDARMNDQTIKPPYPSAFAQAANIQGLLFAYCKSANVDHLALAVKAGDGLLVPVSQGGMRNGDWFEEQPASDGIMPYILNGHLYSVVVLYQLAEMSGEQRFKQAADEGVAALDTYALWFDAGYWTRYDLRPEWSAVYAEIHFPPETNISRIEIKAGSDVWSVCETGCSQTFGSARNGYSFRVAANLPSLREYQRGETARVETTYTGPAPSIYSGVARPGKVEVWKTGEGASVELPIADAGWSTLNAFYQSWHAFLAGEVYERTAKPRHYVLAARWANYIRALESDLDATRERQRPFSPSWDDEADAKITACLGGDPLKTDAAGLNTCGLGVLRARVGLN